MDSCIGWMRVYLAWRDQPLIEFSNTMVTEYGLYIDFEVIEDLLSVFNCL